jgi:DNA-binding IclR family transcriptional regulator
VTIALQAQTGSLPSSSADLHPDDELAEEEPSPSFSVSAFEAGQAVVERRIPGSMVDRAFLVLGAFGQRSVLGVSDVTANTGLPKSTVHRLLSVLFASGFVGRVGDRYCLSSRAFELGNQYRACRPAGLRDVAMPYMADLFTRTGQTVHLAILDGPDVLYLEKIYGHSSTKASTSVGSRRPAYATALGKALLAFAPNDRVNDVVSATTFRRLTPYTISHAAGLARTLDQVRHDGFATDFEESALGIACLAIPVVTAPNKPPMAALSITSTAVGKSILRFKRPLLEVAAQMSGRPNVRLG